MDVSAMDYFGTADQSPVWRRSPGPATLSRAEQYRSMAFAQLTTGKALRDIETCLSVSIASKLYATWASASTVRRSTLADANERLPTGVSMRRWPSGSSPRRGRCDVDERQLGVGPRPIPSTPWTRRSRSACACKVIRSVGGPHHARRRVKMHTLLDLRGNIPSFIDAYLGWQAAPTFMPSICSCRKRRSHLRRGSWLRRLCPTFMCCTKPGAFFVTRAKLANIDAHRVYSASRRDRSTGIICDQTISLDWLLHRSVRM